MDLLKLVDWIFTTFPGLRSKSWVRRLATKIALNRATRNIPSRPYPYCLQPDHTSWEGLVNRRISGRHLACPDPVPGHIVPTVNELTAMFVRKKGVPSQPSARSSLLFAAFAQWFTDSFLRTSHGFTYGPDGNPELGPDGRPTRRPDRHVYNDSNHEIDLCQIYGVNGDKARMLRTNQPDLYRGYLAFEEHDGQMFPPRILAKKNEPKTRLDIHPRYEELHDERLLRIIFDKIDKPDEIRSTSLFAIGLEHGNSTLGNSLFNTIFLREHNRLAKLIGEAHSKWSDDRVFDAARNSLIVMLLKIVVSDYVVHLSPGNLPLTVLPGYADTRPWYRTNRIAMEFNLLYRWHEMVPDKFEFLDDTADYRHNNNWLLKHGVEDLIEALSRQAAGKIVMGNLPWWLESVALDTMELMRASRFASYQAYCSRFLHNMPKGFEEVTTDSERLAALKKAYPDGIESLEWFVGMYAEDHMDNGIMGPLMLTMVAYDAFTQALTNPLLSREVYGANTFSDVGLGEIEKTEKLADLVRRNVREDRRENLFCSFDFRDG